MLENLGTYGLFYAVRVHQSFKGGIMEILWFLKRKKNANVTSGRPEIFQSGPLPFQSVMATERK